MKILAFSRVFPLLIWGLSTLQVTAKAEEVGEPQPLPLLGEPPVANEELSLARGGEVIGQLNLNDLDANLENNQVFDTITGANVIGGTAFSESSGLSSVIQNTGNNVIIQDSTIINIELYGTP